MSKEFVIRVNDYNSKEKIVSGLTDNGYLVRVSKEKREGLFAVSDWVIWVSE